MDIEADNNFKTGEYAEEAEIHSFNNSIHIHSVDKFRKGASELTLELAAVEKVR